MQDLESLIQAALILNIQNLFFCWLSIVKIKEERRYCPKGEEQRLQELSKVVYSVRVISKVDQVVLELQTWKIHQVQTFIQIKNCEFLESRSQQFCWEQNTTQKVKLSFWILEWNWEVFLARRVESIDNNTFKQHISLVEQESILYCAHNQGILLVALQSIFFQSNLVHEILVIAKIQHSVKSVSHHLQRRLYFFFNNVQLLFLKMERMVSEVHYSGVLSADI